jgi:hypothetical protein
MAMRLKLSAEARDEMLDAAAWYDSREPGLGTRFLSTCDQAFEQISNDPQRHPQIGNGFHRHLMLKFPFAVFYEIQGDLLIIAGVMHGARNPARWRRRLKLD